MPRLATVFLAAAVTAGAAAGETRAVAQVCSQPSPGVAHVDVTSATTTIKVVGGIPKANTVDCGFVATAIEVAGRPGNDTIKLNYVPPSVQVSITTGGGADVVVVYGAAGHDGITCHALGLDRDDNSATPDDVVLAGPLPAKISIYGQGGDDDIDCAASPVKTAIYGGDGADTIVGSAFSDTIDAGPDDDDVHAGAGNDAIIGGLGNDALAGDAGNDTFTASAATSGATDGTDQMSGGDGTDVVKYSKRTGGIVAGVGGEDGIGNDVETVYGGSGSDLLDFSIYPTPHKLYGGAGNDVLRGGAGADKLYGEAGNDRLDGAGGKDVLEGGDGNDIFASSADGQAEALKCGAGRDWYAAGVEDTVSTCEHALDRTVRLSDGNQHACAIVTGGRVKCWGVNGDGQLGVGDAATRGDQPNEMGNFLATVDLGMQPAPGGPHTAVSIAAGGKHTCAVLEDGSVKCWGWSGFGQLGLGSWDSRGDAPGEMGNALPAVALGSGRTAVAITAGNYTSCALLDNGSVKCWGSALYGALGNGSGTENIGDGPGEMGDALAPIALGTGRTAIAVQAAGYRVCALLDNGQVKCWGDGEVGGLGNGSAGNVGDQPGEMGDALAAVDLGANRLVVALTSGADVYHSCALLDDGSVKCWGHGGYGNLGYGDASDRGDTPGEMGDALAAVDLGTGRTAIALGAAHGRTCAVLDDRSLKCWGRNVLGSLGIWDGGNRGDQPGEMGDALPALDLGTGRLVSAVSVGGYWFSCAALADHSVKCWGNNAEGELGLGTTDNPGDQPGEMGDALPAVDLGAALGFAPEAAGAAADDDVAVDELAAGDADSDADADGDAPAPDDPADALDETSDGATDDAVGCSAGGGSPRGGALLALALALAVRRRGRRRRAPG